MQLAVADTFSDRMSLKPLAESETLESFHGFMSEVGVPDDSVAATAGLLAMRQFAETIRERSVQPGCYVSTSGRKDTLNLHHLGACFRVPGIDYLRYRYAGTEMPPGSEFHQVCSLYAKAGALDRAEGGSSETQTSYSTDED